MGDAAPIVHEEADIDNGIKNLRNLKTEVDIFNREKGLESRLIVKTHYGSVQAGFIGPSEYERFDIIGTNVNRTATMRSHGFAISVEAFRKLQPETRKLFKKHTPPVIYIDCSESHRD
jgi:class 3 adenylate cyclase